MIVRMIHPDPDQRPSVDELLNNEEFLKSEEQKKLEFYQTLSGWTFIANLRLSSEN